jgi:hypothetical protein
MGFGGLVALALDWRYFHFEHTPNLALIREGPRFWIDLF